jgi:hypothetical protein
VGVLADMAHRDISLSDARRQSTAQSPAYVWNSSAQQLIAILPENAEAIAEAMRRWNGEKDD